MTTLVSAGEQPPGLPAGWLIAIAIATPAAALIGSVIGHLITQRGLSQLDRWRKREETMRILRWAVELAVDQDPNRAAAGLSMLEALLESPMLDDDDVELVAAVATQVAAADPAASDGDGAGVIAAVRSWWGPRRRLPEDPDRGPITQRTDLPSGTGSPRPAEGR
jgi:hypothetical protein